MRKVFKSFWSLRDVVPIGSKYLTTTCHFHIGGFFTPINIMDRAITYVFNHGPDLENDSVKTIELLYQEIHMFQPKFVICGSHHLVLLSQSNLRINWNLSSVTTVMPMGSTVPLTLYEDLKKKFVNLSIIYNMYGMSEVTGLISSSLNVQNLGTVAQGVIVKIVDPNTECICDANEVTISRILKKKTDLQTISHKNYTNRLVK